MYTAAGLAAGNLVHAGYCLIGLGVIISQSIVLFNAVKWLGAAYLIYLGIKYLTAKRHNPETEPDHPTSQRDMSPLAAARTGFFTNLLNPKVTLFFLALFTQIIGPETPQAAQAVYGLTMVCLEFGWFALVASLISQHHVRDIFASISHWVERATGAVLIILGLRLALSRTDN